MAREIRTGEIVALKRIRMDNEREGVRTLFPLHIVNVKLKQVFLKSKSTL